METRSVTFTLEKAREWYNSGNAVLKEIALQAFSEKELNIFDFAKVKTFKDALLCICKFSSCEYNSIVETVNRLRGMSKASAAMFMLNIVRRVLNTGYDLHFREDAKGQEYTWYPYLRIATKNSTYYNEELENGECLKIGEYTIEGIIHNVILDKEPNAISGGLGGFNHAHGTGCAVLDIGLLGCATKEIAQHFGKYFGMLIIEAMYGDIVTTKNN